MSVLSVERVDLNSNGQVDAIKLTFNKAILDSSVDILSSWIIGSFSSSTYAKGSGITGDAVDDNILYITFTENGTLMSGAPFNVNTSGEYISPKDGGTGINSVWNAATSN